MNVEQHSFKDMARALLGPAFRIKVRMERIEHRRDWRYQRDHWRRRRFEV